jgi:hypothetical protein
LPEGQPYSVSQITVVHTLPIGFTLRGVFRAFDRVACQMPQAVTFWFTNILKA